MEASVFDVLTGSFVEDRPIASVSEERHRFLSVMSNLNRLFNSRQGSVKHLPDYGLPDISTVYREAPRSIDALRRSIKQVVQKYEPRLHRVHVEHQDTDAFDMRLIFLLTAEMSDGRRVQFRTTFESQDTAHVRPADRF
ncbi:MAG: type VI secretion system baseplate subunit TssE [Bacteroidetes bacterium]|jgi:type VI secretion system protein|nr:type VI secretion system baseplate subunit TssE [Bacteroidota bacterium]